MTPVSKGLISHISFWTNPKLQVLTIPLSSFVDKICSRVLSVQSATLLDTYTDVLTTVLRSLCYLLQVYDY